MDATARRLVGQEEELAAIEGLPETDECLPGAVVLQGEAGVGKTELWLAGIEAAKGRGYRILTARQSDAASFSFTQGAHQRFLRGG